MISAIANFFAFEIFNSTVGYQEAIGTTTFYAMGIFAATAARKTQSILAQKTFLMSLRDPYRSAKLKDANRLLEILATCDPLTGVANRRSAKLLIQLHGHDQVLRRRQGIRRGGLRPCERRRDKRDKSEQANQRDRPRAAEHANLALRSRGATGIRGGPAP
jgi:hypothetical protein